MDFFTNNLEVFLPIIAIFVDIIVSAIDNSKMSYKGLILRVLALVGDAAGAAVNHESTKDTNNTD